MQVTPNRIALDDMLEQIAHIEWIYPPSMPHLTICLMIMKNGFSVLGKSAPADPANFNVALGRDFAYEDCIRQLWPLFAFALRDRMSAST